MAMKTQIVINKYEEIKALFLKDVSSHKMEVIHDSGLVRHIRFEQLDLKIHWFDLVTWGECLAINGDMGTYTFSRNQDMFNLFRSKNLSINPDYYTEKMQSICKISKHIKFSPTELRSLMIKHFKGWNLSSEKQKTKVWSKIEDEILCSKTEEEARSNVDSFEARHGCLFRGFFEHDLTEFTYHYIWCLYAITWGIQQYDKLNKEE